MLLRRFIVVLCAIVLSYAILVMAFALHETVGFHGVCPPDWTDIPARPCSMHEFLKQELWNPLAAYVLCIYFVPWAALWIVAWGIYEAVTQDKRSRSGT